MRTDAIERAAEMASQAEDRLRHERVMLALQGVDSRWRPMFERAIETHRRAAILQAQAVALFLHHDELRESMRHHDELRESMRREHELAAAATTTVRDDELR